MASNSTIGKSGTMFQNYLEKKECVPLLTSKEHKLRATFEMSSCNTTIANTLRRQTLVATPSVAFKTEPAVESNVKIIKNRTTFPDQMITLRVGMIPIAADPYSFDPSLYVFQLNVKNETDTIINVTASDFIVMKKDHPNATEGVRLPTEQFFPPDPITGQTCLIVRLRPQWDPTRDVESLELTATASIGTGSMNMRWSPVSQCSYENTLDTNEARQKEMFEQWIKESKKVEEGADPGLMKRLRAEFDTMEVKRCFKVNEVGEPNHFTFHIESIGIRSVPTIIMDGILACKTLVNTYKDIDTMIPANVTFQKSNTRYSGIECIFQNENHTLGNLLQTYLTYNHIEGSKEPKIAYTGYKIPHPLRPELVVMVALFPVEGGEVRTDDIEIGVARYALAQVCRSLVSYFEEMAKDWSRTTGIPIPIPKEVAPLEASKEVAPALTVTPAEAPKEVAPAVASVEAPKEVAPAVASVEAPPTTPREARDGSSSLPVSEAEGKAPVLTVTPAEAPAEVAPAKKTVKRTKETSAAK
jgi:DNA-directed RNA polymerase subunit L/DNA-directed RNA polymerase alpha subunit